MSKSKVVFITGASSGIGKALAYEMMLKGNRVYGTSRKASGESTRILPDLPSSTGFIEMLELDVRHEQSITKAINYIKLKEGHIDILINSAGYGFAGPIEETTFEEAFAQFDTNFFGVLRVLRGALPLMRQEGKGLIINISSVAGFIPIPFQSMYSASKYALESMTESLRMELKPFGINVVIVEPGDISTGFTDNRALVKGASASSPYYEKFTKSVNTMIKDEKGGPGPEIVAKSILRIIEMKNPPVRVTIGFSYKLVAFIKRIIPDRLLHYILLKLYS